jgi:hypothetical protein
VKIDALGTLAILAYQRRQGIFRDDDEFVIDDYSLAVLTDHEFLGSVGSEDV